MQLSEDRFQTLMESSELPLARVVAWVAVKELKLSHYFGETLLFTIYSHYGNLI